MDTIYVIEDTLLFNPTAHTLHSIKSNEHITLAIPASLCFDLLIKNKGRIVTQAELLQNAWGERGMNVTPNTLHQNISLLRKSLKRLEVKGTLIQTIPKRGFMIGHEASILNHREGPPPENAREMAEMRDDTVLAEEHDDKERIHDQPSVEPQPGKAKEKIAPAGVIRRVMQRKIQWSVGGITLLLLCLLYIHIKPFSTTDSPFASYTQLATINSCKALRNDDLRFDEYYTDFLKEHNIRCSQGQTVYITNHYPSSRTSLIVCRYAIKSNKKSFCTSSYYLK